MSPNIMSNNRNFKNEAGTLATTTREAALLDEFPSQGCSLLGSIPCWLSLSDHQPTDP